MVTMTRGILGYKRVPLMEKNSRKLLITHAWETKTTHEFYTKTLNLEWEVVTLQKYK